MNRKMLSLIVCCLYMGIVCDAQKSFVIVIASYNNKKWYKKNLDSVFDQTYDNWRLIYIDDCSDDGTKDLVTDYVASKNFQDRVTIISNQSKKGHLANQYTAIHGVEQHNIVVILDGDDWLAHENVLSFLNEIYQGTHVWITYGQFQFLSSGGLGYCAPLPQKYIHNIRALPVFIFSHLRTFYAGLFQKIKLEDLMYEGNFYPRAADVAIMYPMIEMAGSHVKYISESLYVYNNTNPLSFFWTEDHKILDAKIRADIAKKTPYQQLNSLT